MSEACYFLIGLVLVAAIGYLAGMWDAHSYYMADETADEFDDES